MTKNEFKNLTDEQLINLYIENNYSLTKMDKKFNFSNDFSRRVFLSRGINYNEIRLKFEETIKLDYTNNPNLCQHCGKPLSWGKRNNKFCCRSCSTSENNLGITRNKTGWNGNKTKTVKTEKHNRSNNNDSITEIKSTSTQFNENCNNCCMNCGKKLDHGRNFCDQSCQGEYKHKKAYEDFLNNNEKFCNGGYTPRAFKDDFLSEQGGVCDICGCKPEWNGKPLVFILDHIDGDASNNRRSNLRVICPNCDSQLPTYKSKNKNSKRRKYWKEKIIRNILNNIDDKTDNKTDNNKNI